MSLQKTFEEKATSSFSLDRRLEINANSSINDFQAWLFSKIPVTPAMRILEIGCGSGAQSRIFSRLTGAHGIHFAIDKSEESIKKIKSELSSQKNFLAISGDMNNLKEILDKNNISNIDLVTAIYSLYYSKNPRVVLDIAKDSLTSSGMLAVATPVEPHGMVEFCRCTTGKLTKEIDHCLSFAWTFLIPYFREKFNDVSVYFFKNKLSIHSIEEFLHFYRETTYFSEVDEPQITEKVRSMLSSQNKISFDKNGVLVTGRIKC
jgi:ubiquinone/menaquinone biosynthesis C-methylase UbiE